MKRLNLKRLFLNIKKATLTTLILGGLNQSAMAQNPAWILPTNDAATSSYYDWGSFSDIPLPTTDPATGQAYTDVYNGGYIPSQVQHQGAANGMVGVNGELLFFIIGNSIFDSKGRTIFKDDYSFGIENGRTEISVVPDPADCKRFYIFTNHQNEVNSMAGYLVLDISEQPDVNDPNSYIFNRNPNAKGRIIHNGTYMPFHFLTNLVPHNDTKPLATEFAISPKDARGNYNLFFLRANGFAENNYLYTYKITPSGVNFVEKFSLTNPIPGKDIYGYKYDRNELEVFKTSNNTYQVVTAASDRIIMLEISNDLSTLVNGLSKLFYPLTGQPNVYAPVSGIEYSPNGRYVYFTHETSSYPLLFKDNIHCWDLQSNTFVNLPWQTSLENEFQYSFIEKYNDKLYMVNNTKMAEIDNVDTPLSSTINQNFLPVSYISNTYYGYFFQNKRYTLPDQIDDADYLNFMTSDPLCCIAGSKFDVEIFDAHTDENFPSTTQVWTPTNNPLNGGSGAVATVTNELNIPEGYNIIIQDMVIKFLPDAELNIRRGVNQNGGQLELKNSTLTVYDDCGGNFFWQGVDVEGYYDQPQVPLSYTKQGIFKTSTRSTVEYAVVGAEAIQEVNGNYDNNFTGGIIRSDRATWRNNQMDVRLLNYNPGNVVNQCSFIRSTFITDVYLPELEATYHVYLMGVGNLYFKGNIFTNQVYNSYAENLRGWGIYALNSKFNVVPSVIGNTHRPIFSNLAAGVIAASGNTFNTVNVDKGIFENNQFGVGYFGLTFSKVTSSDFQIAENSYNSRTAGIFLYSSTGYQIEANKLYSDQTTGTNGETYGIIVHNSGPINNFIYRNIFKDLKIGGQTQRINGQYPDFANNDLNVGLKWQCNNFMSNINVSDLTLTSGNMDYQQGLPAGGGVTIEKAGARNVFSHDVDVSANEFDFFMNPIVMPPSPNDVIYGVNYRYYPSNFLVNNLITEPQDGNYTVGYSSSPYLHVEKAPVYNNLYNYQFNYAQSCPSKLPRLVGSVISVSYSIATIKDVKQQIADKIAVLNNTNQNVMLDAINLGTMSNGQLKNLLLSNSPMLSDEVIIAYIESNPPNGQLLQILFNNGPLSTDVIQALNDNNALSNWWLNLLSNYYVGASPYNQAVNEIKYLNDLKDYKIDDYIRYYMMIDTNVVNPIDSVISVLELEPESKYRSQQLVDAYIYKKELTTAQSKNNALKIDFGVDNFTYLADVRIAKTYGPCLLHNIAVDPTSKAQVEQIVTDSTTDKVVSTKAKCYLFNYADPSTYDYIIEDLYMQNGSGLRVGNDNSEETEEPTVEKTKPIENKEFEFSVYPNPANETLHINIQGLSNEDNAIIEIANVSGQVVYKGQAQNIILDVNISDLPNGMYFVMIRTEKQILKVEKVVVE